MVRRKKMKKGRLKVVLTLPACAKVNLHLRIGRRRADGYHSLQTLFQEISLHDDLTFQRLPSRLRLITSGGRVPKGRSNLIVKALALLRKKLRLKSGMEVRLKKRIPVGGGLGGASSDAAAALWGGWLLWTGQRKPVQRYRKQVPPVLFDCARRLGADVPFFLKGGKAEGKGIGENLRTLPRGSKKWLILIYPRVSVSTAKAYQWLDEERKKNRPRPVIKKGPRNDFEPVVLPRFPAVARARSELIGLGCRSVMLSGSGSCVFGFVGNRAEGSWIAKKLAPRPWNVFLLHTR
ncbi:MAG: 4-(cytidine 5'-diphospho)-2-C-methyl-D-erythritol kinase [Elusimicrobia bacterium]|nr:4-(cytidine 5'-diphospho)-2-C-methyl-D-erythritol kinase [Candidatus Obscuribacterium magneticum]MCB4755854.1 4-(cytidine 5'-diphospho)-2-C-methyl-D-erythritol kinase [Candidatus Obscuribacterium magneticum]